MNNQNFQILSGREQILKRPGMWLGSMDLIKQNMFVILKDSVELQTVEYKPSILKIINEIVDNSLDALVTHNISNKRIKVTMTDTTVTIEDNGPGIPVVKASVTNVSSKNLSNSEIKEIENTYVCELAWTRLFSGSNFEDDPDKITVGAHGIGSKATAIFSTNFVGISDDGKKRCRVTATNNLEKVTTRLSKSTCQGVKVEFEPDLARFEIDKLEDVYKDLVYQRLLCLSISFPDITFYFNNKKLSLTNRQFVKLFSENAVFENFDKGFVAVFPNTSDEFNFFTYVNGLSLTRGGNHVEYITTQIVNPIRERLVRRFKTIRPGDIRNKLSIIIFLRDFPNSKYDSQTKETLTNAPLEVSNYLDKGLDFDKIARTILRTPEIIDPIVETFKIKENVKEKLKLKNAIKSKVKIDPNKYIPPVGENKFAFICEGFSSAGGLSQSLGRVGNGFYASRGVPLNVMDAKMSAIAKNAEFHDIMSILGIDPNNINKDCEINFETIVHANDADCLHEDTYILTKRGDVKLKNLEIDDEVLTHTGKYKPINLMVEKEFNEYVSIKVNGNFIHASKNHRFLISRENERIECFAKDLKTTDFLLEKTNIVDSYNLISIEEVVNELSDEVKKFIDIEINEDHSFFFKHNDSYILSHNCDGLHILGIYMGWWLRFAPHLFEQKKIARLLTPYVILWADSKMTKIHKSFFSLDELKKYEENHDISKYKRSLFKGLGSWSKDQFQNLFDSSKNGINDFLQYITLDDLGKKYSDNWLRTEFADKRKEYLKQYSLDIEKI